MVLYLFVHGLTLPLGACLGGRFRKEFQGGAREGMGTEEGQYKHVLSQPLPGSSEESRDSGSEFCQEKKEKPVYLGC